MEVSKAVQPAISSNIFNKLIERKDSDEKDLTGVIGFTATYLGYHIDFFGEAKDGFKVVVEECVKIKKGRGNVDHLEVSPKQVEVLQSIIDEKVAELEEEESRDCMEDTYRFIEHNFYSKY
ncbi:MAG: hypothetical protein AAGF96_06135 [Bacteroidota bacterium]